MKKMALLLGTIIFFSGCTALNVAQINYDVILSKVDRSPAASTARVTEKPSRYGDNLVEADFFFTPTSIDITILNKTDETLKLVWDDSAFIDRDGNSTQVARQRQEEGDPAAAMPPSIIPARGMLSHVAIPTNLVAWQGGADSPYGSGPGNARNYAILPYQRDVYGGMAGGPVNTTAEQAQRDFVKDMQGSIGSKIGLVLSFRSANLKYEYTFWFEIREATLVGK